MKCLSVKSLLFLAALAAGTTLSWAANPLEANMYVGTLNDVIGFDGCPLEDGAYIEFRAVNNTASQGRTNWTVFRPDEKELLATYNPLKTTSKVGDGVIPAARGRGLFAACVPGMVSTNRYYVRLFDGPSPGESVAYCDSFMFLFSGDAVRAVTNVQFRGIWKSVVDGSELADSDEDGLVDLAEEKFGTKSDNWDSDGDSFSDGFEHTHGMDPLVSYALAIQLNATPVDESLLDADEPPIYLYDVTWASVSGLTYTLEYIGDMLAPEEEWTGITNVTATGTETAVPVDEWYLDNPSGFFRVWTVIPKDGAPAGE